MTTSVLPDPATDFGARVARRLAEEPIAWLTLVDGAGTPQPAPIWFLWEGESALFYSHKTAKRLDHLARSPRVSMHLNADAHGGDVVVLTGLVAIDGSAPPPAGHAAYLAKYETAIRGPLAMTPESFGETYSVALRFTPAKVRGF